MFWGHVWPILDWFTKCETICIFRDVPGQSNSRKRKHVGKHDAVLIIVPLSASGMVVVEEHVFPESRRRDAS